MKILRRFRKKLTSNIYVILIGIFVLSLGLFAIIVGGVGYFAFSSTLTKEYKDSVYKSALVATEELYLDFDYSRAYLDAIGPELLDKLYYGYYLNQEKLVADFIVGETDEELDRSAKLLMQAIGISEEEFEAVDFGKLGWPELKPGCARYYFDGLFTMTSCAYTYFTVRDELTQMVESMNLAVMYYIVPDPGYETYTCLVNCPSKSSGYTAWSYGTKKNTSTEEYAEAYRRIYEEGSTKEVILRNKNLNGAEPHVTALVPVYKERSEYYDENGKRISDEEYKKENIIGIFCVQRDMTDLKSATGAFLQGLFGIAVFVIIIINVVSYKIIRKKIIKPVKLIEEEAKRFAHDNTKNKENKISENVGDVNEIKSLAVSIEKMEEDTLKNIDDITNMTKDKERISYEVSLASEIQQGMLPKKDKEFVDDSRFDIHALMHPAKQIGGDFFDFFMIDDKHIAILVADVSDKGVGAAFFMAISKTLIKSRAKLGGSASEIITYADRLIAEKNPAGMFVTVWLGIINLETGYVNACNAGHDYPAIMKLGEGYSVEKAQHGPPVGFIPGMEFIEYDYQLKPGERIFLYTDGLAEAKSPTGDRFGIERMLEILNDNKESGNEELINTMKKAVDEFAGNEPQFDDITMMGFTYYGDQKKEK